MIMTEDFIEVDYNFKEAEHTVVAASKLKAADHHYLIQSVVIIGSHQQKCLEMAAASNSSNANHKTIKQWSARSRSYGSDRRDLSPTHDRRCSALDRQRSLSRRPVLEEEQEQLKHGPVRDSSISARRLRREASLLDSAEDDILQRRTRSSSRDNTSSSAPLKRTRSSRPPLQGSSDRAMKPLLPPTSRSSQNNRYLSTARSGTSINTSTTQSEIKRRRNSVTTRHEILTTKKETISPQQFSPYLSGGRFLTRVRSIPRTRSRLLKLAHVVQ